jgi:hypothetical protein
LNAQNPVDTLPLATDSQGGGMQGFVASITQAM